MKLFNPTEVIQAKEKKLAEDIKKANQINELLSNKRLETRKLETEFYEMLSRQERQWEEEKTNYNREIEELRIEVNNLERRKMEALVPLNEKKEDLEKLIKDVENKAKVLDQKKE